MERSVECRHDYSEGMVTVDTETEKLKSLLRPFDLEKALAGAPVYTREGLPVSKLKQGSYTGHWAKCLDGWVAVGLPLSGVWQEDGSSCFTSGWGDDKKEDYDLFLGPTEVEHTGWIAVYTDEQAVPEGLEYLRKVTGNSSQKLYLTEEFCKEMHPDADCYREISWRSYE